MIRTTISLAALAARDDPTHRDPHLEPGGGRLARSDAVVLRRLARRGDAALPGLLPQPDGTVRRGLQRVERGFGALHALRAARASRTLSR